MNNMKQTSRPGTGPVDYQSPDIGERRFGCLPSAPQSTATTPDVVLDPLGPFEGWGLSEPSEE